ncbi:MAG: type II toxin-antitoxin system prevent-host-death family antitoxin [Lachnospiraceae bacterium]|nr:type II toxin-antitoxin system prevent-host-death family antitoxin [Lachnospiraceae bacterium]
MIAAKPIDIRTKLKSYLDIAFNGEPVVVSRKGNRNVVIVSEAEYNELAKAKRKEEYKESLERSIRQVEEGKTITKTMEELIAMED